MSQFILDKLLLLKGGMEISDVEIEWVRTLLYLQPNANETVLIVAALCANYQLNGNLCFDLQMPNDNPGALRLMEMLPDGKSNSKAVLEALEQSELVGKPGEIKPMILEDNRVYLQKYWKYETELAGWITERVSREINDIGEDESKFVESLFRPLPDGEVDWQKAAVYMALVKDFLIISGGPGTGKTFTVSKIIECLLKNDENLKLALAAPTGKAAQRLSESLATGAHKELEAKTLHRLLGAQMDGTFRYGVGKKLPYDVILIDEASMLDIRLWIQLIRAIKDDTKLILLGDKDQLSSVEAGAILGDICFNAKNRFSPKLVEFLNNNNIPIKTENTESIALDDSIVLLTKSHRFRGDSDLKMLADAVNDGNADLAIKLLEDEMLKDVQFIESDPAVLDSIIQKYSVDTYLRNKDLPIEKRFNGYSDSQILCVINRGQFGIENINLRAEQKIKKSLKASYNTDWYDGRYIIFTSNNRQLGVQNGETGIYAAENGDNYRLYVEGKTDRQISAGRVQEFRPAYAITVHKSQGSEYKNVAIILTDFENPVLSKELLYTAITRAREKVAIIATKEILRYTISRKIIRNSGLAKKLGAQKAV